MAHEESISRGALLETPTIALLNLVTGVLFIPYALSKGYVTTAIKTGGWQVAGLAPAQASLSVHLAESVPVALMAVGLAAVNVRTRADGMVAVLGLTTAFVGFAATILTHLGEHLLNPFTVPALTGGADWYIWGYYLSWLTLYAGLALYGVALIHSGDRPRWLPYLFVFLLPVVSTVGLAVALLDVFTLGGTLRLGLGVAWILVGRWLWKQSTHDERTARSRRVQG